MNDLIRFKMCTTAFLIEVSQSIKFGDLTQEDPISPRTRSLTASASDTPAENLPDLVIDELPHGVEPGEVPRLSNTEEDTLLRESTRGFPDWVASFIRRVILLFENLPEDTGGEVRSGGESDSAHPSCFAYLWYHHAFNSCRCRHGRLQPDLHSSFRPSF